MKKLTRNQMVTRGTVIVLAVAVSNSVFAIYSYPDGETIRENFSSSFFVFIIFNLILSPIL